MKHYRNPAGEIYAFESDGSQDHLIRKDMVALTDVQVAALRTTPADPAGDALAQIKALELAQLLPRAVREFMLLSLEAQATADALAKLPAYVKLKAFDDQIAALRAIIRGTA